MGRGRPERKLRTWSVDRFDRNNSTTCALISMCIKEDYNQTLTELAERLAYYKERPLKECLAVLRELKRAGNLGYFEHDYDYGYYFRQWQPGRKRRGEEE